MRKLLCLLLVSIMALGLVACGKLALDDMVGQYQLTKMKQGSDTYSKKDIDQLKGMYEIGFEIKKDGYAYMTMGDDVSKAKVDVDKQTMKGDGVTYKFTYKDGDLKLYEGKDYMILKKKK